MLDLHRYLSVELWDTVQSQLNNGQGRIMDAQRAQPLLVLAQSGQPQVRRPQSYSMKRQQTTAMVQPCSMLFVLYACASRRKVKDRSAPAVCCRSWAHQASRSLCQLMQ